MSRNACRAELYTHAQLHYFYTWRVASCLLRYPPILSVLYEWQDLILQTNGLQILKLYIQRSVVYQTTSIYRDLELQRVFARKQPCMQTLLSKSYQNNMDQTSALLIFWSSIPFSRRSAMLFSLFCKRLQSEGKARWCS